VSRAGWTLTACGRRRFSGDDDRSPLYLAVFEAFGDVVDLLQPVPGGPEVDVASFDQRDEFLELGVLPDERSAVRELAVDHRLRGFVDVSAVADDVVVPAGGDDVGSQRQRLVATDEVEHLRGATAVGQGGEGRRRSVPTQVSVSPRST